MSQGSILFVDDDRETVDSLSYWFRRHGYDTTETYRASNCLLAAAQNRFDVAVVDIGLPDMNGFDLLQELEKLNAFPVVVLSGYSEAEYASRAQKLGAANYLVKPVSLQELESAVTTAIDKSRGPLVKSRVTPERYQSVINN